MKKFIFIVILLIISLSCFITILTWALDNGLQWQELPENCKLGVKILLPLIFLSIYFLRKYFVQKVKEN